MTDTPFTEFYLATNYPNLDVIKQSAIDLIRGPVFGDSFDTKEDVQQALLELNDPDWSPTRVTMVKISLSIEE